MGSAIAYRNDVFISYSHIDNEPFGDSGRGWVDTFCERLLYFVNPRVGRPVVVWRDRRLTGQRSSPTKSNSS